MKYFLSILAIAFALSNSAFAEHYVSAHFGPNHTHLSKESNKGLKMGYKAGLTYGYGFASGIRVEGQISYLKNSYKAIANLNDENVLISKNYHTLQTSTYMANIIYDINDLSYQQIIPYFGFGLGYAKNSDKIKIKESDQSTISKTHDDRFAYQGIAGIKYPVNESVFAGLEYHYLCGRSHAKNHSVNMTLSKMF